MRTKRILVAYSAASTFVATTLQHLLALKDFTDYDVKYVHATHQAQMNFDFNEFDVLIHNYCARLCFDGYLSTDYERAVAAFRGLKIAVVQDDYDRTIALHRAIRRLGFHALLTSIQSEFWHLVYPKWQVPGVKLVQALTGYVPANRPVPEEEILPLRERPHLIAYRGRDIGARYGRLGFEKYEIGRRMIEICEDQNIPHDIGMDEASRIYGDNWYRFLGSSRTMLGSESGSNAFDFDGVIESRLSEFAAVHGRAPTYPEVADFLEPLERPFDVGQISPRVFECAMMRTPMILFRGQYSGAIEPGIHYIPLEKDFSNATDVLSRLHDLDFLKGFADRAHDHLIASGRYSYGKYAGLVSALIEEQYPQMELDAFVRHRNGIAAPAPPVRKPDVVASPEDAVQVALGERPTDYPQTLAEFTAKQDGYVELLRMLNTPEQSGSPSEPEQPASQPKAHVGSDKFGVALHFWRILPEAMRKRISPALRRLADEADSASN
ncbi:hypothetical protein ACVILK_002158 [Bradyrhizobium embrapense]